MRSALLMAAAVAAVASAATEAAKPAPAEVDRVFADLDRPDSPGCALAVVRDGHVAYERGYGMANLEHRVAITPHTVFDIGSTSKQFTAAAIHLLAAEGRLSLRDDVRRWVPELPAYETGTITIRHLLQSHERYPRLPGADGPDRRALRGREHRRRRARPPVAAEGRQLRARRRVPL
jgi:CubicO group peptidase (beta-lactamase class C family)